MRTKDIISLEKAYNKVVLESMGQQEPEKLNIYVKGKEKWMQLMRKDIAEMEEYANMKPTPTWIEDLEGWKGHIAELKARLAKAEATDEGQAMQDWEKNWGHKARARE